MKAYNVKVIDVATHGGGISDRIRRAIGKTFIVTENALKETVLHDCPMTILLLILEGVETRLVSGEYQILQEIDEGTEVEFDIGQTQMLEPEAGDGND